MHGPPLEGCKRAQETREQVCLGHQVRLRHFKLRVESLERELLQREVLPNHLVEKENRELQRVLERSQKSVAADHRVEAGEKTYVESISFTRSSPSLWGKAASLSRLEEEL